MIEKITKSDEEWQKILTSQQYRVMRKKETEHPFTCSMEHLGEGTYSCAACNLPLFYSSAKFESGTGWPSYFEPINKENIIEVPDNSLGTNRTEVICARCDSHLGHVFADGPPPTGKRYCINGVALNFTPKETSTKNENKKLETVAFGGGCFWCTEVIFLELNGVIEVTSGYAGGTTSNPTYQEVSTGDTGHAEVIQIVYDANIISFKKLLEVFFESHDPTTLNKQGNDTGTQYRSILLYTNDEQLKLTEEHIQKLTDSKKYSNPIVTEVVPLDKFYPAEEYHKKYYENHPYEAYSRFIIKPKLDKIKDKYSELLKSDHDKNSKQ